jgi:hypothetical protein
MPAAHEIKTGFWLGLGIFLALAAIGFTQMLVLRAVQRNG